MEVEMRESESFVDTEEDRERISLDLKAGLHPLKHKYVFWYTRRTPGVSYEDNIKKIVDFTTVEGQLLPFSPSLDSACPN